MDEVLIRPRCAIACRQSRRQPSFIILTWCGLLLIYSFTSPRSLSDRECRYLVGGYLLIVGSGHFSSYMLYSSNSVSLADLYDCSILLAVGGLQIKRYKGDSINDDQS